MLGRPNLALILQEHTNYESREPLPLLTGRELKRGDPRAPIECAIALQILVGVPEGAVVRRIHADAAVIAPTVDIQSL